MRHKSPEGWGKMSRYAKPTKLSVGDVLGGSLALADYAGLWVNTAPLGRTNPHEVPWPEAPTSGWPF